MPEIPRLPSRRGRNWIALLPRRRIQPRLRIASRRPRRWVFPAIRPRRKRRSRLQLLRPAVKRRACRTGPRLPRTRLRRRLRLLLRRKAHRLRQASQPLRRLLCLLPHRSRRLRALIRRLRPRRLRSRLTKLLPATVSTFGTRSFVPEVEQSDAHPRRRRNAVS